MPQNEADRIAQQRVLEGQRHKAEALRQLGEHNHNLKLSSIQQLEAEIPVVLQLMAKKGFPGMVSLSVEDESLTLVNIGHKLGHNGHGRIITKGGWSIGKYEYPDITWGGYKTRFLFLLSDGRILFSHGPMQETGLHYGYYIVPPREISDLQDLSTALKGIQGLRP